MTNPEVNSPQVSDEDLSIQHIDDFIHSLRMRSVQIKNRGGKLSVLSEAGVLQPADIDKIHTFKQKIIDSLKQQDSLLAPIRPRDDGCQIPLTVAQRLWWTHTRSLGVSIRRTSSIEMRVTGPLNGIVLQHSLDEVIQRHEALRTRVVEVGAVSSQAIDPHVSCQLNWIDLSKEKVELRENLIKNLIKELSAEHVDLYTGLRLSGQVYRLSDREHIVALALDHFITDGDSNAIITKEIWTIYDLLSRKLSLSVSNPSLQFPDYAVWQHQTQNAWLRKNGAYWRARLIGAPNAIIPCDKPVSESKDSNIWRYFSLMDVACERLCSFAREQRTYLALVILSIHAIVMSTWCDQEDLLLFVVDNGRNRPELTGVVGSLATALFLRVTVRKNDRFIDLVRQVDHEFRLAQEHYDDGRAFGLAQSCRTDVVFNWFGLGRASFTLESYQVSVQKMPFRDHNFPVKFGISYFETQSGVSAALHFRPDLLSEDRIDWFARKLHSATQTFAYRPDSLIGSI